MSRVRPDAGPFLHVANVRCPHDCGKVGGEIWTDGDTLRILRSEEDILTLYKEYDRESTNPALADHPWCPEPDHAWLLPDRDRDRAFAAWSARAGGRIRGANPINPLNLRGRRGGAVER